MGSFYATCSITRQTIVDGQEMYMQFMLPSIYGKHENDTAFSDFLVEMVLETAREEGVDAAAKQYKEMTSNWNAGKDLSPKGMLVSNEGACVSWIPFGPAIRGYYDDYGNIRPADDEDSVNRVQILESLMGGLPFSTIMEVAQDDRWYTYGLGRDSDSDWKPEGISKEMPDWQLTLCKKLSLTYFHASVYDEMSKHNFSSSEKDGVLKSKYYIKWKDEYLSFFKEGLLENLALLLESYTVKAGDTDLKKMMEVDLLKSKLERVSAFRNLNADVRLIYQARMVAVNKPLDWFYETLLFIHSMNDMEISLQQSEYGSQEFNWFGWKRINNALNPNIDKELDDYYGDEDDYEDDDDDE